MEYRPLGRTGVQVSKLCLGTMMFGAWGNTDHDDSIRIIHARARRRDQLRRHRRRLLGRRVGGDRRQGAQGPPRRRRPGHQVLGADGRGPQPRRRLAALDHHRGRELAAAAGDRLDRPLPDAPPRPATPTSTRPSARSPTSSPQGKVRYIGSSSFSAGEIVEAQWTARERRLERFRTEQPPYSLLVRGIELDVLPTARRHGMGILTYSPLAGGWLSGSWTADSSPTSPARQRLAARFDMSLPENQRKLEAVQQLAKVADDAGVSLIELAIAFVVNHPAVTSAIIGPRTMEQLDSQLPAADVALDPAVLDRIDEIVKPGVNLNPADTSYGDHVLQPALRRR